MDYITIADAIDMIDATVPKPYAVEIYKAFLELQIHLVNKEYDRYNASSAQYSNHYDSFVNWWHCNHMPNEIAHIKF